MMFEKESKVDGCFVIYRVYQSIMLHCVLGDEDCGEAGIYGMEEFAGRVREFVPQSRNHGTPQPHNHGTNPTIPNPAIPNPTPG